MKPTDTKRIKAMRIRRRKAIMWFSKQMEMKLKENDYKGGWSDCNTNYLIDRLLQEWGELLKAHLRKDFNEKIISECADIANFAMMIADNLNKD